MKLNRATTTLRHLNDELTRAGEAIIRTARAPRPARPATAKATTKATITNRDITERVGRAA